MTLIHLFHQGDHYDGGPSLIAQLRVPAGESLRERAEEFCLFTGLAPVEADTVTDWNALLRGQPQGPGPGEDEINDELRYMALSRLRLAVMLGTDHRPAEAFIQWLVSTYGWETLITEEWTITGDEDAGTFGSLTGPVAGNRPNRQELTDEIHWLFESRLYTISDAEKADLETLGWTENGTLPRHHSTQLISRVEQYLTRVAAQRGVTLNPEHYALITPEALAATDNPDRPGQTALGRAAGYRHLDQAPLQQLTALARTQAAERDPALGGTQALISLLLLGLTPQTGPAHPQLPSDPYALTTGDIDPFGPLAQVLKVDGRWPA